MARPGLLVFGLLILAAACSIRCTATEHQHQKRAPSGFTGVRGKKSIPDTAYSDGDGENLVASEEAASKRAPSGFMGMRGKKPYPLRSSWFAYPDDGYKRAPSGFMGMRGKKDQGLDAYDGYPKRAPSGFMGMRGKKDQGEGDLYGDDVQRASEKRAPSGFTGVRGKKEDESKRTPTAGFFGMRGKKQPGRSGFFGMRGKKYPYQFKGKFVGVRGKKTSSSAGGDLDYYGGGNGVDDVELAQLGEGLDINQLMLLLTESDGDGVVPWQNERSAGVFWPQVE